MSHVHATEPRPGAERAIDWRGTKGGEEGTPRRQGLRAVSRNAGKYKDLILLCNFLNNISHMDEQDMRSENSKILESIFSILSWNVGFPFSHRCGYNW